MKSLAESCTQIRLFQRSRNRTDRCLVKYLSVFPSNSEIGESNVSSFFLFRARKPALHSGMFGTVTAACQLVGIFPCFIHEIRSCLSYSQIRFSECRRGISPRETCRSTNGNRRNKNNKSRVQPCHRCSLCLF